MAAVLGRERFVLFGGAALDMLQDPSRPVQDLDVALPFDRVEARLSHARLAARGIPVDGRVRRYWIHLDQPVLMFDVHWEGWTIDLNFVDGIRRVPPFDIESVMWRYPETDYVDLYGAFEALATGTVRPVRGLEGHHPYLLMDRMIRLAAKYDLTLARNRTHRGVVAELGRRVAAWTASDDFNGPQAIEAHHRHIASAVLRSSDPAFFLADLAEARALESSVIELHRLLVDRPDVRFELARVRTAGEFWSCAVSHMAPDAARSLRGKLADGLAPRPAPDRSRGT